MRLFSNIVRSLGQLGLYRLAALITKNQPKVLVYHRFSETPKPGYCTPKNFEQQLQYICRYYNVVSMSELAEKYYDKRNLAPNTIAITVDDGYEDFYNIAFPLLKKYQLPATLYVATGFIENKLWLWPDQVSYILDYAAEPRAEFLYDDIIALPALNTISSNSNDWQYLIDRLLEVNDATKHTIIKQLANTWNVNLPTQAPDKYKPSTEQHLIEMANNNIEIGGHTVTHPSLGRVDDFQAQVEVTESKKYIDDLLGMSTRSFCYPNGTEFDYNETTKHLTEQCGYSCAVTAYADNQGLKHRFAIRRHGGGDDMFQFFKAVSGVEFLGGRGLPPYTGSPTSG